MEPVIPKLILQAILFCLGALLVVDGIGSIIMQSEQPFLWWQAVRLFRTGIGFTLMVLAILL